MLDDGRVLAADNTISETYDPATNQWTAAGTMSFRYFHVLVKLPSGRVLAAGGEGGSTSFIQSSAQIFDPQTRTWTDATPMTTPRARALATRLADGRVLVVGGWDSSEIAVSSAEVYDAVAGTWTPIGAANHPYQEGTATLLNDGRVLLVGPYGADVYDPVAGTFTSVPADNRFRHIAALLQNGKVLLTGGTVNTSQIFDPATNSVGPAAPMAKATRWFAAGTTISDGTVLIAGGYDVAGHTLDSIERYDPASNTWFIHDPLALQRESAVMVPLASGEALVIGGSYRTGPGISMVIPASQGAEIVDSSCTPTSCGAQNASCGSLSGANGYIGQAFASELRGAERQLRIGLRRLRRHAVLRHLFRRTSLQRHPRVRPGSCAIRRDLPRAQVPCDWHDLRFGHAAQRSGQPRPGGERSQHHRLHLRGRRLGHLSFRRVPRPARHPIGGRNRSRRREDREDLCDRLGLCRFQLRSAGPLFQPQRRQSELDAARHADADRGQCSDLVHHVHAAVQPEAGDPRRLPLRRNRGTMLGRAVRRP